MRKLLLASLMLSFSPASAWAGAGTSSADFLQIGLGARAASMGGSFVGIADDASAIYWNPAGLSQLLQQEAGFLHTQWIDGINYEYAMYAYPHEYLGTFGASFSVLQKNSIPSFDETGNSIGSINVGDSIGTIAWGKSLMGGALSLGLATKWIQENLAGYTANSYAVDLGGFVPIYEDPFRKVTAGIAIRNLGSHGAFVSDGGVLPRTIDVGIGFKGLSERLSAGLDGVFPRDQDVGYFTLGGEYWIHPMVAVRAGYKFGADAGSGFSTGLGFRVGSFQFDYALSDFGVIGFAHRGGVTYRFGKNLARYYEEGISLMRQGNYAEAFLKFNKILTARPDDKNVMIRMKECQQHIEEELKEENKVLKQ